MTIGEWKYKYVVGIIFILVGCGDSNQTTIEKSKESDSTKKKSVEIPVAVTTEMTIIPFSRYESPFYADTTINNYPATFHYNQYFDSTMEVNYCFNAKYPQSKIHDDFNGKVKHLIDDYFRKHIIKKEDSFFGTVNATIIASDFNNENDFVSVLFTEQDYYHGAAHYNHGYLSLNYDLKNKKEIKLTDLVLFKQGEAPKFCDAFNPDPTTTINEILLEGNDFEKDRAFTVSYGELVLYFNDYEKGPSMTLIRIPYSRIKGYINPKYKYLFENFDLE